MSPPLLFITNSKNSDPEEDLFLSAYLNNTFEITVANPNEAVSLLPGFSRCLIRNAWPSRFFVDAFTEMRKIVAEYGIKSYNPFHRGAFIEDKTYLLELCGAGYPVIPTIDSLECLDDLPAADTYIIKPKDGCSSIGVEQLTRDELFKKDVSGFIIQPRLDFTDEVSFYFIDDAFSYATISAGPDQRWELTEYQPTEDDIAWASRFVSWNALPYGLQRIDACRMPNGEFFLMEIEDAMPMLTLSDLSEETRSRVLQRFTESLLEHLR